MSAKFPPLSLSLPSAGEGDETSQESGDNTNDTGDGSTIESRLQQQHEKPELQEPPAKRVETASSAIDEPVAVVVPDELRVLMFKMQDRFRCLCKYHSLEIGSSLNPLSDNTAEQQNTMDLTFLNPLKIKDSFLEEAFFPVHNTLYVRECMRDIFELFCEDVKKKPTRVPEYGETVLIGSPGVGKSLLFFLAALYMAQKLPQPRITHVIYCRRTKTIERVSVFIMTPNEKTGGVHVLFTRNLLEFELGSDGLMSLFRFLFRDFIIRERCYVFIDGPRHDDDKNTLDSGCDYLCTGGHPDFKDEQKTNRMWVLDGWTESEAIQGLNNLGHEKSLAKEAYNLCGGNLRAMLQVCCGKKQPVKDQLDGVIVILKKLYITLAIQSTERKFAYNIPDVSWTMFRDTTRIGTNRMDALQVVDSSYMLNQLCECLDTLEPFLKTYKLTEKFKVKAAQGLYFEKIVHQWVRIESKCADSISPIKEVCFPTGTAVEGVCQLSKPNMYWVPSVTNFAGIDSALVIGNLLFAFQMAVHSSHNFDVATFERSFVKPVKEAFQNQLGGKGLTGVVVIFVVPIPENEFTMPKSKDHSITKFLTHQVITNSFDTVSHSMHQLLQKLLAEPN
jgi:hypothetical protein